MNVAAAAPDESTFEAQYIEDYLDFANNIPDEIARHITMLHEIQAKYLDVLKELDHLWEVYNTKDLDPVVRKRTLIQAQNAHIQAQELGDSKLQQWQAIQDIVENKSRTLELDKRRLDFGRESDVHSESFKSDYQPERTSKRSRRQRNVDVTMRDDNIHEKSEKDSSAPTTCKKKKKKRKSRVEKEPIPSPFEPPIDPDEPTYCLCDQVSFGEMICCDNTNCDREWFHFSCVGLTFKPKGKWYCPKCRGERSNQMKPQVS